MDSKLKCEFCRYVSFLNVANKKRHFLNFHNFAFKKAKSYKKIKPSSYITDISGWLPTTSPTSTAEQSTTSSTAVSSSYEQYMDEDGDQILLALSLDSTTLSAAPSSYEQYMDEDGDQILLALSLDF